MTEQEFGNLKPGDLITYAGFSVYTDVWIVLSAHEPKERPNQAAYTAAFTLQCLFSRDAELVGAAGVAFIARAWVHYD